MLFEDEVQIGTDTETTWELVSDPEVLVSCVPGAEDVERVSDTQYRGTIKRGVAGINIALEGEVLMTELEPPTYLAADANGEDAKTGSRLDADAEMTMSESGPEETTVEYEIEMDFTGRLATLGARMSKRLINRDINTFFDNLKQRAEDA
jgi:carbon monoxide dehydrogenase subunit G